MVENIWLKISKNISGSRDQWLSAKSTVSPVASSVRIQIQNLTLFSGGSRSGAEGHLFIVEVVVEYVSSGITFALLSLTKLWSSPCLLWMDSFLGNSVCVNNFSFLGNFFSPSHMNLTFVPPEKEMRLKCVR